MLTKADHDGGLSHTWTLIGLVSFGSRHCGGEAPTVLTRVSSYTHWIAENTGEGRK